MKFSELEYRRPDVARIQKDYRELVERTEKAETEEEILDIWEAHQRLGREYNLPDRTVYIRNTMNVKDEFMRARRLTLTAFRPSITTR